MYNEYDTDNIKRVLRNQERNRRAQVQKKRSMVTAIIVVAVLIVSSTMIFNWYMTYYNHVPDNFSVVYMPIQVESGDTFTSIVDEAMSTAKTSMYIPRIVEEHAIKESNGIIAKDYIVEGSLVLVPVVVADN